MSFIRVVNIEGRRAKAVECECDFCHKIFTKRYLISHVNKEKFTFCCVKCKNLSYRKEGKLRKKYKETCLKKYGVNHHTELKEVQEKFKLTCLEKYGVEHPQKSKDIQEKIKKTCLKKYGVDHSSKSKEIQEKISQTCLERYGVNCPIKSKEIQEKVKQTCLERYGSNSPLESKKIQEKIKQTFVKKYGVDNPWKLKKIQEKIKRTLVNKYGVDNPGKSKEIMGKVSWKDVQRKCHKTMKRNGSYGKSMIEDEFYTCLCERFGHDDVERQVVVNDWNIDFFVKSLNVYIQFDGVYWHGLDRPIEVIKEFDHPRDKTIYETHLRDQRQSEWFKENGIRLMRITDEEFKSFECIDEFFSRLS